MSEELIVDLSNSKEIGPFIEPKRTAMSEWNEIDGSFVSDQVDDKQQLVALSKL